MTVTDPRLEAARAFRRAVASTSAELERERSNPQVSLQPLNFTQRTGNELRPSTFAGMVGQERIKSLMRRIVTRARETDSPLDHMLLVGSAGTGKTTLAQVVAHELGRTVYMVKAPVEQVTLEELARVGRRGDVIVVDEVHLFSKGDRRGVNPVAVPEQLYSVLEDHRLQTATGVVGFPEATWIGCTTDAGQLPEPLLARFPLQPHLDPYTEEEMYRLAHDNARSLGLNINDDGATTFALACRATPRVLNRYVRNAVSLTSGAIDRDLAREVVTVLNSTTLDGLTQDMQNMLRFMLGQRREDAKGNVTFKAGLSTIATALGKSRDSKAIMLFVEPHLIARGYVGVTHGGRALTDAGVARARAL